jgi:hypothetical protein
VAAERFAEAVPVEKLMQFHNLNGNHPRAAQGKIGR